LRLLKQVLTIKTALITFLVLIHPWIHAGTTTEVFLKFSNKYFIETGSYQGDGIQQALDAKFQEIYSIELAPCHYEYSMKRFCSCSNVHLRFGDSAQILSEVLREIDAPATFWLDGNYSGGTTAKGQTNTPLLKELEAIRKHPIKTHTILIDDVRLLGTAEFDHIKLDQVIQMILEINPKYQISFEHGYVRNDVLVARIKNPQTTEIDLSEFEAHFASQGGEDGIIETFFSLVEPQSKFCVEFGAGNGFDISNTYYLRKIKNWKALLLECTKEDLSLNLHQAFVTSENINALFAKYHVPENVDFISIDIDFNDLYVWHALDTKYKPALICIEYNNSLGPKADKTVVYNPLAVWDETSYFGASVTALYQIGRQKGYSLIYMEKNGLNCFFARDDILEDLKNKGIYFKNVNDISKLFINNHGCFPQDPLNRPFISAKDFLSNSVHKTID